MTTITKTIDLRIEDYDVEIELDSSDLEEFDSDELWTALLAVGSTGEIGDLVHDDSDVLEEVLSNCSNAELVAHIDRDQFVEELIGTMTTDERKEACLQWLGESVEGDPLRSFLQEQVGEPLQAIESMSLDDALAALIKAHGAARLLGTAVEKAIEACKPQVTQS